MMFFSYGTLRDAAYQRELFDRTVPTVAATLHDWQAVFAPSGYLTIVPRPGARVAGALVTVDERELAICDAWEEVPLYVRTPIAVVDAAGCGVATWAYVHAEIDDGEAAPEGVTARADRAAVIAAIRRFRARDERSAQARTNSESA